MLLTHFLPCLCQSVCTKKPRAPGKERGELECVASSTCTGPQRGKTGAAAGPANRDVVRRENPAAPAPTAAAHVTAVFLPYPSAQRTARRPGTRSSTDMAGSAEMKISSWAAALLVSSQQPALAHRVGTRRAHCRTQAHVYPPRARSVPQPGTGQWTQMRVE